MLKYDFEKLKSFNAMLYLPNGVENTLDDTAFNKLIDDKYKEQESINLLYLSNMIKSKGYFEALELANQTKNKKVHYHFAGGWQCTEDEKEFFDYIEKHNLSENVTFYGFVNGNEKQKLLENAHLFIFPTRYPNEAFPLSILEALSYGVPVISTDEGSIPYIIDQQSGIILGKDFELHNAFEQAINNLLDADTAKYCRKRYTENFSLIKFEQNLINLFKKGIA